MPRVIFARRARRAVVLLLEDCPQQTTVHPLDHHVEPAALFAVERLHDSRVIENLADLLFALETLHQNGIGFQFRMGHLDCHLAGAIQVRGPVEGRHPAARHRGVDAVVIQHISGFKHLHRGHLLNRLIVSRHRRIKRFEMGNFRALGSRMVFQARNTSDCHVSRLRPSRSVRGLGWSSDEGAVATVPSYDGIRAWFDFRRFWLPALASRGDLCPPPDTPRARGITPPPLYLPPRKPAS